MEKVMGKDGEGDSPSRRGIKSTKEMQTETTFQTKPKLGLNQREAEGDGKRETKMV